MEEAWDWDDLDFSFRPTDSMAMATVDEEGHGVLVSSNPSGHCRCIHPQAS